MNQNKVLTGSDDKFGNVVRQALSTVDENGQTDAFILKN